MNEEKIRIEAHKKAFDDLALWIWAQFEKEIKFLLPSAVMTIKEWYSREIKDMIAGASVHIEIKDWIDSVSLEYLCVALGAKEYRITAYPLRRLHIILKVPISSQTKLTMQCTGMWKPKWRKEDGQGKDK